MGFWIINTLYKPIQKDKDRLKIQEIGTIKGS